MDDITSKNQFNLPNTLTITRIALVPVFLFALYRRQFDIALAIFTVSAITDFLDGYFARRFHELTRLGQILDPIADKVTLVSSFVLCGILGLIPIWLTVLVVGRDIIVMSGVGALYLLTRRFWIKPRWLGKAAIATEFVLLCLILLHERYGLARALISPVVMLTAVLSALSGVLYVLEGMRIASSESQRRQSS